MSLRQVPVRDTKCCPWCPVHCVMQFMFSIMFLLLSQWHSVGGGRDRLHWVAKRV